MVPAKELHDWVHRQGDSVIGLRSKEFDTPKMVNVETSEADIASKAAIKKIGLLELVSKDASKTGSKWSLDNYDSTQIPSIDFNVISTPLFIVPLEQLNDGIKNIGFSAMGKDSDHLFDTISFQQKDESLYMITTDCARCALWNLPNADKITLNSTITDQQLKEDGMKGAWKSNLLVPAKFLTSVCKLYSHEAPIAFYRDEVKNRIYLSQPGFIIRMATAEKSIIEKYPPLDLFMVKDFTELCTISVETLNKRLNTVSIVNKNAIMFNFTQDKLILSGVSESGQAPCKATMAVFNLNEDFKKVWNVKHFLEVLKVDNSGEIKLMIPSGDDKSSLKLVYPDNKNAIYFAMAVERSKYNLNGE